MKEYRIVAAMPGDSGCLKAFRCAMPYDPYVPVIMLVDIKGWTMAFIYQKRSENLPHSLTGFAAIKT